MSSRSLDLTAPDSTLARQTGDFLCAFRFDENKKSNYARVLKLCSGASLFLTQKPKGATEKAMHLVAFGRDTGQLKLAYAVMEEMRLAGWKFLIYANDRLQSNRYALRNMLDCACKAARLKDPAAHCHMVLEDPFEVADPEATEGLELWLLPCQLLNGFVRFDKNDVVDIYERLDAAALDRNVNLCPLYKPAKFDLIKTLKKPSKKRYWD